jgi:2-dehydro-3-deoxyglucarate aldolase/4-hydroxy-2-oxoheptanedioate aldolase
MTNFKEKLKGKSPLIGILASLGSVEVVELLSHVGADFIWIDAEHSAIGVTEVQAMVQAIAGRTHTVVRVPANDEAWIKKVLDTGADGIVVPQVNSAEEARKVVQYCYYPPKGRRSVGATRAQTYGLSSPEYFAKANDSVSVIVQVEHIEGVGAIEEILDVEGLDTIFIGPIDLSASLGVMGQLTHPTVKDAIAKVQVACKQRGMPTGFYARDVEAVKYAISAEMTMIAFGSDTGYLRNGVLQALAAVK